MYTTKNIDRRRIICIIGIIVGIVMLIVGFSLLQSSNIHPKTELMEDYFNEFDHQKIKEEGNYSAYLNGAYVTVYMAHQMTILCTCFGWLIMLFGAFTICLFVYKMHEDANLFIDAPTESIIKPKTDNATWTCGNCNTVNSSAHGQCKKCGKFR